MRESAQANSMSSAERRPRRRRRRKRRRRRRRRRKANRQIPASPAFVRFLPLLNASLDPTLPRKHRSQVRPRASLPSAKSMAIASAPTPRRARAEHSRRPYLAGCARAPGKPARRLERPRGRILAALPFGRATVAALGRTGSIE